MTAILDRIQTVRNKLDSFENIDQAQDYISTLSSDDYFALKIFLKSWKNLKLFIAKRNDVDDELMIWLEILGIYLTVPDEDRKRESKEKIKTEQFRNCEETLLPATGSWWQKAEGRGRMRGSGRGKWKILLRHVRLMTQRLREMRPLF